MAFKQYTKCIEPSEYTTFNHMLVATFQSLLVGVTATALALAKSRLHCWPLVLLVIAAAWIIAYCRLFLYQRLICLGGDRDVIGVAIQAYSSALTDYPDNDFKVNLLLQNTEFGDKRPVVKTSTPFGYLVHEQDKITAAGLPTEGYESKDAATGTKSEALHCEFEGAGAYVWLIGAEVGFALAVAALILCVYLPPIPFLKEIMWALALLALLALALGSLIALGTGGSASDVNPNLGEIHTNTEDNGGLGKGADILYIQGTWVYDPWHTGWNEIHPVKICTKVGCWKGDWTDIRCGDKGEPTPPIILLRLQKAFQEARAEETLANQALPEHQWHLHPDLDGCARVVIL